MALMIERVAVAAAMLGLLTSACRQAEQPSRGSGTAAALETREARVAPAVARDVERTVSVVGVLAPHEQAGLSVKAPGRLAEISVDVGSRVSKGDVIAAIERRDYELRVQQAQALLGAARARLGLPFEGADDRIEPERSSVVKEAAAHLEEQRRNRDRLARLREEKIIPEADVETAEAAFQVALNRYEEALIEANNRRGVLAQRRAEFNIAQQLLADTEIRAPFDGVIQDRRASPGDYLPEGAVLATLVRIDPIRLRLEAAEREAFRIQIGQTVRFRVDGDTNLISGKVSRVSPSINETNRMLAVEADIRNDGRLRPGSFVRGDIVVTTNSPAILVRREAVRTFAGIEKVFIVEDGKASERRITTGTVFGDEIEVVRGLNGGEFVILNSGGLRSSQPVRTDAPAKPRMTNGT